VEDVIFLTFGAGNMRWNRAAKRLIREASNLQIFSKTYALDEKWLRRTDHKVAKLVNSFLDVGDFKGFGYWAWKSSVLSWAHEKHPTALLVYLDSGFVIPNTEAAKLGFLRWIELARIHGSLALSLPSHPEYAWTKQETIQALDPSGVLANTMQIQGGFIFLTPAEASRFLPSYQKRILESNGTHIRDNTNFEHFPGFISHRNDQSVFSLIWKQLGMFHILDETDPKENLGVAIAARYSSGFSFFCKNPICRILRFGERVIARIQNFLKLYRIKRLGG